MPVSEHYSMNKNTSITLRYKKKLMGNVRFIGKLLNCKLLASRLLPSIAQMLQEEDTPICLECLITLIDIVGPHFDCHDRGQKAWMDDLFQNFFKGKIDVSSSV